MRMSLRGAKGVLRFRLALRSTSICLLRQLSKGLPIESWLRLPLLMLLLLLMLREVLLLTLIGSRLRRVIRMLVILRVGRWAWGRLRGNPLLL